ncbi:MAG: hypothetical protein LKG56_07415 [Lachnospiraceae bacterium]|nr:hypothetical protein [Lachnospiraceae bacterium]MCH4071085.1 hypothetical protein [Lachnospiraceae bacterium]MCH4108156.1 hypothetical protein [Lachnospiraceae bacterium]MCI1302858.1 hypothetical protein [Lachnospiraceae bacterium]MCI1332107.1 hypothetical protein [Lachnospiraceae bacterium]
MDAYEKKTVGLPPDEQQIVAMKILCGMSHREISKALGKPVERFNGNITKPFILFGTACHSLLPGLRQKVSGFIRHSALRVKDRGSLSEEVGIRYAQNQAFCETVIHPCGCAAAFTSRRCGSQPSFLSEQGAGAGCEESSGEV